MADLTEAMIAPVEEYNPENRSESPVTSSGTSAASEEDSDDSDLYKPGCFEGPEKNLEVIFRAGVGNPKGCRTLDRPALDAICLAARCTILSQVSNGNLDAYVLSESSLFVYPHKMILKTCGRTTLLRCLNPLLRFAGEIGLELEWIGYSRKNYTFPDDQYFPHSSFSEEFAYLKKHPNLEQRLDGSGYVLGPITGDHFLVYVSDKTTRSTEPDTDRTINIMMFELDTEVADKFYKSQNPTAREMTLSSGINSLVPGAVVDDRAFEPCGYSMNAILYGSYSTVHITPEPECSYASFETNTPLKSYTSLINNVLSVFKPGRVVITMMADSAGLQLITENPFDNKVVSVPSFGTYTRSSSSFTKVEGDCCVLMGNWELTKSDSMDLVNARTHRQQNRLTSF